MTDSSTNQRAMERREMAWSDGVGWYRVGEHNKWMGRGIAIGGGGLAGWERATSCWQLRRV